VLAKADGMSVIMGTAFFSIAVDEPAGRSVQFMSEEGREFF